MQTEPTHPVEGQSKIRLGISSCLLGSEVRYDGGHKYDAYINGTLAKYFELIPVCPEVAIGLGTPREPIHLVRRQGQVRVVGVRSEELDVTDKLIDYGRQMAGELAGISGYILKRASPSCGMERVKLYDEQGKPVGTAPGMYAHAFMEASPLLPVEEEGRLGDPVLRENFIERVFVYHRWQKLVESGLTRHALVEFHTDHKYLIMAHDVEAYARMGRLVGETGPQDLADLAQRYAEELMGALKRRATRKQHANVLQHLSGYLHDKLDTDDRQELAQTIHEYREGFVPLIVPITLLKHHFRRHPDPYVSRQVYLNPHPKELMLRNAL